MSGSSGRGCLRRALWQRPPWTEKPGPGPAQIGKWQTFNVEAPEPEACAGGEGPQRARAGEPVGEDRQVAGACCYLVSDAGARGLPTAPAAGRPRGLRSGIPAASLGGPEAVAGMSAALCGLIQRLGGGRGARLAAGRRPRPPPPAAPSPGATGVSARCSGQPPPPAGVPGGHGEGLSLSPSAAQARGGGSAFGVGESQQVPGSLVKTPGSSGGGGALTPPGPFSQEVISRPTLPVPEAWVPPAAPGPGRPRSPSHRRPLRQLGWGKSAF